MGTILVVDDMPICREPIEAALFHAGYTAIGASSGQEALAHMNAEPPDLEPNGVAFTFTLPVG